MEENGESVANRLSSKFASLWECYVWVGDRISLNFLEGRSGDEVVNQG